MSWHKRRQFMALAGAALTSGLSGCTFTPAYAPGGPSAALQGAVRVESPITKEGFDLVEPDLRKVASISSREGGSS